jgi:small subunit ribosomal protein S2
MTKLPQAMVVVDPRTEHNAVAEAHRLGIPVFGLVDTNCDPDDADFVIPANDDAIRSVKLIVATLANAVVEAKGGTPIVIEFTDEPVPEEKPQRRQPSGRGRENNRTRSRDAKPRQPRAPRTEASKEEAAPVEEENVEAVEAVETPVEEVKEVQVEAQEAPVVEEVKAEEAKEEAAPVEEEKVEE